MRKKYNRNKIHLVRCSTKDERDKIVTYLTGLGYHKISDIQRTVIYYSIWIYPVSKEYIFDNIESDYSFDNVINFDDYVFPRLPKLKRVLNKKD